jgi:hypothetical protein
MAYPGGSRWEPSGIDSNSDGDSTFHCFANLPLELRYEVYELHFYDNHERVLTAKHWPKYHFLGNDLHQGNSALVLPNLCLASKGSMKEAGVFLLLHFDFEFKDVQQTMQFLNKVAQFQNLELDVVHSIHSLQQRNTNEYFAAHLYFHDDRLLVLIE